MKIFTLNQTRSGLGPAQKLIIILLGLLFLHLTSSPTFAQGSCSCNPYGEYGACESVDTCDSEFSPSADSCPTDLSVGWGCEVDATCTCVQDVLPPCECDTASDCGVGWTCPWGGCDTSSGNHGLCVGPDEDDEDDEGGGIICPIPTPIGPLPCDLPGATGFFFGIMVEIIGLLAIIMFAFGGYQAMTAGDNPDRLQEAKAKMTAAITGFFFLLLFVKIITIIGVNILGITPLCHILGSCP